MSHNHTIYRQILQMFSRFEFQKAVKETKPEYHSRGFRSWNHFVSMLFGQLSGQDSLRGIEAGLASQSKTLYHLGVKPVYRSTLSYANEHRSHELFKKTFEWMGKEHEQKAVPQIPPEKGDVVVFDRRLTNFDWYRAFCDRDIYLVTRLKRTPCCPNYGLH